jgi:16S rRNA (guanine527-N7)-methyltransferase
MPDTTQPLREHLQQQCEQRNLVLTASQGEALLQYLELLVRWQKYLNLTGLHNAERMLDVLIIESLDFLRQECFPPAARVLDLGSGAGVPGIPLAICVPEADFTLLDRSEKKMTFVRRVIAALRLHHSTACCSTVEDFARHLSATQRFDVVVSRGVGTIAHLSRLAAPCLRPGGFLLLRKPLTTPEVQEAAAVLAATGWHALQMYPLRPASTDWGLVVLTRQGATHGS